MALALDAQLEETSDPVRGAVIDDDHDEYIYLITDEPLFEPTDAEDFDDGEEM